MYSENKKLQKLCHDFSDFENSKFSEIGQDWRDEFYKDCYAWDHNLEKNNIKKWRKVIDKFGEAEMGMLSIPCKIKKFLNNNVMNLKEISEEEYLNLFVYIAWDWEMFEDLYVKATTPGNFKFLLNIAIKDFINQEHGVGEKILKLAYKYRDNPSKFIDFLLKETLSE